METPIRLTQFSHGAGCGCKIAPATLKEIVQSELEHFVDPKLLVGNQTSDDAAVYDLGNGQAIISTTDFFMPIVDDPFDFGRVAATNAISDIYAMGGRPIMAIAILGWPINQLSSSVARQVVEGGRHVCHQAGISLAGGHSIDAPEPIFGLAVTGIVDTEKVKQNNRAKAGDHLLLTKPLGVGILTTAEKKGLLQASHQSFAIDSMTKLNDIGFSLGQLTAVSAMTDVTGFGLLGHLLEMCESSGFGAEISLDRVPKIAAVDDYLKLGAVPGGTGRNFASYGEKVGELSSTARDLLCDPQTSGGLLLAVAEEGLAEVQGLLEQAGYPAQPFGRFVTKSEEDVWVNVC